MRTVHALRSAWQLKRASLDPLGAKVYWQAGKRVAGTSAGEPAASIVARFEAAARTMAPAGRSRA